MKHWRIRERQFSRHQEQNVLAPREFQHCQLGSQLSCKSHAVAAGTCSNCSKILVPFISLNLSRSITHNVTRKAVKAIPETPILWSVFQQRQQAWQSFSSLQSSHDASCQPKPLSWVLLQSTSQFQRKQK